MYLNEYTWLWVWCIVYDERVVSLITIDFHWWYCLSPQSTNSMRLIISNRIADWSEQPIRTAFNMHWRHNNKLSIDLNVSLSTNSQRQHEQYFCFYILLFVSHTISDEDSKSRRRKHWEHIGFHYEYVYVYVVMAVFIIIIIEWWTLYNGWNKCLILSI